jgi:hypothetical protein
MPSSFATNQAKVSLELQMKSSRSTKPTSIEFATFVVTQDLRKMTVQPSHISAMSTESLFNPPPLDISTRIQTLIKGVSCMLLDQSSMGATWWDYAVEEWI